MVCSSAATSAGHSDFAHFIRISPHPFGFPNASVVEKSSPYDLIWLTVPGKWPRAVVVPVPSAMAGDFKFEKGESFGEWLHAQYHEAVSFETESWAIDRINRVESRLQATRPEAERLVVEIPWLDEVTAFTAPGRYIYFSRRLYER